MKKYFVKQFTNHTIVMIIIIVLFSVATVGGITAVYIANNIANNPVPTVDKPPHNSSSSVASSSSSPSSSTDKKPDAVSGTVNSGEKQYKSQSDILEDLKKAQSNVTDKIDASIAFHSGQKGTIGQWTCQNDAVNNVVIQAQLYDGDTMIAETPALKPNQFITSVQLLNDISSGSRKITVYINYYNLNSQQYIGKAGYIINMSVS
jgi:hypothetical protein